MKWGNIGGNEESHSVKDSADEWALCIMLKWTELGGQKIMENKQDIAFSLLLFIHIIIYLLLFQNAIYHSSGFSRCNYSVI